MAELYVQVVNIDGVDTMKECWDHLPECGIGNEGWKNAIEVKPEMNPRRQRYTGHVFDVTVDPVQIKWGIKNYPVQNRINDLISAGEFPMFALFTQMARKFMAYDPELIASTQATTDQLHACLKVATTHNQLDAIEDGLVKTPEDVLAITEPDAILEEIIV